MNEPRIDRSSATAPPGRDRSDLAWTEANTRRLLQAAVAPPDPDDALIRRVGRQVERFAALQPYLDRQAHLRRCLQWVVVAYLVLLLVAVSAGGILRMSLETNGYHPVAEGTAAAIQPAPPLAQGVPMNPRTR